MQIIEAVFSLIVLMGFTLLMTVAADFKSDYSLYQYQLANDVWRVLYLKYGDALLLDPQIASAELEEISQITSLCIESDFHTTCNVKDGITIKKHTLTGEITLKVGR